MSDTVPMGIGDRMLIFLLLLGAGFVLLPWKIFILFGIFSITIALWRLHHERSYFTRHGVPSPKSEWIMGHSRVMFKDMTNFDMNSFHELGTTYFGAFMFDRKEYTNMDLDFIKDIAVKEFSHFQNRMFITNNKSKVARKSVMRNLVSLKTGEDWKRVRNRITPTFTTGKIKKLIPTFNKCVKDSFRLIDEHIVEGKEMDLKNLMSRIGMDVIGHAGFSIDIDAYSTEESLWLQNAKKTMSGMSWKTLLAVFCPALAEKFELLGIDLFKTNAITFFENFLLDLYEKRKVASSENEKHTDLFQLLLDNVDEDVENLANGHKPQEDSDIIHNEVGSGDHKKFLTKAELISQSFLLLLAGFETTATALHFIVYMLALFPEVQEKVRIELEDVVGDEEEITFEHLQKFTYMNQVIQETLRMYNPAPRINRQCNDPITLKGLHIEYGDLVNIPVNAMHYNPEFFPDPYKFDPERFTEEEKAKRDPRVYLPFGIGPRNCLGMRFAEFQMRIVIGQLVKHFRFEQGESSPNLPIKMVVKQTIRPEKLLMAKVQRR